ncbi:hypothetical protein WOLCODRAFT_130070 [Wolfiporia cocos MD-104 SS10]|uniref:Chromatin remodeling factor mit1 n=1 Tax=Wolfiporia cocos (strain MD-104) TaxID=742152 RepID=A0A2H3IWW3_WOLCO|nr:hypothetical protein WOLCODRAFT_130070 [Wolfiporia cocos MD-104 SS10]
MSDPSSKPQNLIPPEDSGPLSDAPGPAESESPLTTLDSPGLDPRTLLPASEDANTREQGASRQPFYISLPSLSAKQKALYEPDFAQRPMAPGEEFEDVDFDSIIGEYGEDDDAFYYVKLYDGIVHKFPANKFAVEHPDLVDDYERKKEAGTLPPFDPSASYVHHTSRMNLTLKLSKKVARKRRVSMDSSNSDELAMPPDSESDSAVTKSRARRNTRAAAAGANKKISRTLPFSPKKTRSRKVIVLDSDLDSDEEQELQQPSRRSTRNKKAARSNLADGEHEELDESSSDELDTDEDETPVKSKVSRPAYGHFRVVADLELDEEEDGELAPLRAHRKICEKCHRKPAHQLLEGARKAKRGRKPLKRSDEDEEDEEEKVGSLGGWVRCLKCPVSAHWGCLAKTQRDEILKAALERDRADWRGAMALAESQSSGQPRKALPEPFKRAGLEAHQTTEFICGSCMKGGVCMVCRAVVIEPDTHNATKPEPDPTPPPVSNDQDVEMADGTKPAVAVIGNNNAQSISDQLLFRCVTCRRLAHYEHLPIPPDSDVQPEDVTAVELAEYYQETNQWQCADCASYAYAVEHIIAWRPYPENAVEPAQSAPVNYKSMLPREYLVKWIDRSYRRTSWVPHGWLLATHAAKLKNFLQGGSKIKLLPQLPSEAGAGGAEQKDAPTFSIDQVNEIEPPEEAEWVHDPALRPIPDAQQRILPAWTTVDRVLDVLLFCPEKRSGYRNKNKKKGRKRGNVVGSDDDGDNDDEEYAAELAASYESGEQPSDDLTETVQEYVARTKTKLTEADIDRVVWAFFKWDDLGYEDASWDSPPRTGEAGYEAFAVAFKRFIAARNVQVLVRTKADIIQYNKRPIDAWRKKHAFTNTQQPALGQASNLKLMSFQVEGVNWLCNNWWNNQHCILADEMGLGKTVQIACFVGYVAKAYNVRPALIVVPNSTISNWVREFERWAPNLRVVPFYGEAKAREIIKRYEMFHEEVKSGTTGAKYDVVVTTYEMITNPKEFTPVFKKTSRWEILVVDEGQRLKSDESIIFKKLKELNTDLRVIMTGTPLNNNIRELFALMNFLDPGEWQDLDALSKQYEELSEESVKELHQKLKPYFLRRIKSEVLQLPPKNEVIVPVSMAPLQKEVYRSILSQNLNILRNLVAGSMGATVNAAISKSNMNNILMQLRKCLQHPYLVSDKIEPKGLSPIETHAKLIDASAKLGLLRMLLTKLRERGHRVLLFSQFSIALDIIEDFLNGEGIKYLRLDGTTKQADRQKDMDAFNEPGSDIFIYLLTTRAGGVGINLWTADTVIIFDPDFNPHQDLQAIARAHRFGQKKTCLVFKLMVKGSAEDKIMQTGKKKLVLDHLIVQKMDDQEGSKEDIQSILMFGAKALFEEGEDGEDRQIHYSEHDVDSLIEKTEKEGEQVDTEATTNGLFSFAKVWSADKDSLEEMPDDAQDDADQVDSWAQTLERIAASRANVEAKEATGRGVRRRAAAVFPQQKLDLDEGPEDEQKNKKRKGKHRSKSTVSDDSDAYAEPTAPSQSGSDSDVEMHPAFEADDLGYPPLPSSPLGSNPPPSVPESSTSAKPRNAGYANGIRFVPETNALPSSSRPGQFAQQNNMAAQPLSLCSLCGEQHPDAHCPAAASSENLAQYRLMLICHAGDESLEARRAAIDVIDETLHKRGMIHLIQGQPLHLVERPAKPVAPPPRKKQKIAASPALPRNDAVPVRNGVSAGSSKSRQSPSNGQFNNNMKSQPGPSKLPDASQRHWTVNVGPSSGSLPFVHASDSYKRRSRDTTASCPICGRSPHHLVKDCAVVAEGPASVDAAIRKLELDPTQILTVNALRGILHKQQRRSGAGSGPSIEVSD